MGGPTWFRTVNFIPPYGVFFYETHGEKVTGRTFLEIEPKVRALMAKYSIKGLPEQEVAAYMCARMPDPGRYCRGSEVKAPHVRPREAISNSLPYCSRRLVDFAEISRRLRICAACPMHARDWCPTCSGHVSRMEAAFGGRRPKQPEDAVSGVCQCAKAYEIAIASVEYGKDEAAWEGAPDTCWRKSDV